MKELTKDEKYMFEKIRGNHNKKQILWDIKRFL